MKSTNPAQGSKTPLRNSTQDTIENQKNKSVSKPFTTSPKRQRKRRPHIVRRRSLRYIKILTQKHGITREIPLEKAKEIFQEELDLWNPATLKAYFGVLKGTSEREITRTAEYQTGTVSKKIIRLTQKVKEKKGYLERLGLVSLEKRGSIWFLILESESIAPEFSRPIKPRESESLEAESTIPNLSLEPILFHNKQGNASSSGVNEVLEDRERERVIGPEINPITPLYPKPKLTLEELRILETAKGE